MLGEYYDRFGALYDCFEGLNESLFVVVVVVFVLFLFLLFFFKIKHDLTFSFHCLFSPSPMVLLRGAGSRAQADHDGAHPALPRQLSDSGVKGFTTRLCIYLFVYLFICLFICLCVCLVIICLCYGLLACLQNSENSSYPSPPALHRPACS